MPENTFIYDTVWEEYREEHDLSIDDMNEFIWQGNRDVIADLERRANHMMWQLDQRSAWMCGDEPLYRVPEDCPFLNTGRCIACKTQRLDPTSQQCTDL